MYENLKYCVYIHRRKTDNSIFYIGSGREYRAQSPSGRTSIWKNEADTHGFIVEILESDLSKAESLERELHYYDSFKDSKNLVNTKPPALAKSFDKEFLSQYVYYDETSETFLRWNYTSDLVYGSHRPEVGKVAGTLGSNVNILKVPYSVHKVVWALHYGDIPADMVIDHIDGNPKNNNINNLRMIPQSLNCKNRGMSKNNKTSVSGVVHYIQPKQCEYFRAQVAIGNGRNQQKYFSVKKYGNEEAFRLACEWRSEQIRLLNEQGAGYTERHGT